MENEEVIQRVIKVLDSIRDELKQQSLTLVRNTVSLEEHMKRSELLEESIDILRNEIKPVQKQMYLIEAGLKIIGGVVILMGAAASVVKIAEFFMK